LMRRLLHYVILPPEISRVEREYLLRMNRVALIFFVAHFPLLILIAAFNGTDPFLAAKLCALTLLGPLVAYKTLGSPRSLSLIFGLTSVFMGGLLLHFGQGPMQIEMHFYFSVVLALLSVFGNPMVIIASAAAVALHHLLLFLIFPSSVFNYEASLWTVTVHILFVGLETIAACFVARSFFDNVVGLETIVDRRTEELNARNSELKLVLDNVGAGFLAADRNGHLATEHSLALETWLGPFDPNLRVWEYFEAADVEFGRAVRAGWEHLADMILPQQDVLDALPRRMSYRGRELTYAYKAIAANSTILIVVTDVTAQLERDRLADQQRETMNIFRGITSDRGGSIEFLSEGDELLLKVVDDGPSAAETLRAVHTLKGNASLFGISSLVRICHEIEGRNREGSLFDPSDRTLLSKAWASSNLKMSQFLGADDLSRVSVDREDYLEAIAAVRSNAASADVVDLLESWQDEPAFQRLNRIADQAKALADRLGKGPIEVEVQAGRLRLPKAEWAGFWGEFTHVVRNAVDHGLEEPADRIAAGKPPRGRIHLSIERAGDQIRLMVSDDGLGISWPNIRTAAVAAGLPYGTPEELVDAMVIDGITSRKITSEVSGRGVGMGAIRAACLRMGGTLRVTSQPGLGTQLLFLLPATIPSISAEAFEAPRRVSSYA
jgi:two-component system, chemotaxis family, sensor kinase CheA